jgi:hypothetical protein
MIIILIAISLAAASLFQNLCRYGLIGTIVCVLTTLIAVLNHDLEVTGAIFFVMGLLIWPSIGIVAFIRACIGYRH